MPPKRKATNEGSTKKGNTTKRQKVEKKSPVKQKGKATNAKAKGKGKKVKAESKSTVATVYTGPGYYHLEENLSNGDWKNKIQHLFQEDYFKELQKSLNKEAKQKVTVFPPQELVFNAFNLTPFDQVKVVILGQDPYHDDGQAHGLSFSVPMEIKVPKSLQNIYKEIQSDYPSFVAPSHGNLEKWAKQGVLMINATMTVRAHEPNSHAKLGWQQFTDDVIRIISEELSGVVFLLWGGFAHKKQKLITDTDKHGVVMTAHPSGLSYSKFKGCACFAKVNSLLKGFGKKEIDWSL